MLARLSGTLVELADNAAVVAPDGNPGTGYEVLLPAYLARTLEGRVGQPIALVTIQYLEGQNQGSSFIPRLIGFATTHDRDFFELLTSVKGLGNKRGLRAMALEPSSIARAITERDTRFLQRLPEIGPKLAELIVHELKTKADRFVLSAVATAALDAAAAPSAACAIEPKTPKSKKSTSTSPAPNPPLSPSLPLPPPPIRQTVDALIALGESPIDAERMVARALDAARAAGRKLPASTEELLGAAYSSR